MVKTVDTSSGKVEYSKFVDYLHYESDENFDYVIVRTDSAYLEISDLHLIQRKLENGNGEFVYARDLALNDEIFVNKNGQIVAEPIKELKRQVMAGGFAPLTESGTILVNNVFTSCYANCQSHSLSHIAFGPLRWWHRLFSPEQTNEKSDFFHTYVTGVLKVFGLTPFSMIIDYY